MSHGSGAEHGNQQRLQVEPVLNDRTPPPTWTVASHFTPCLLLPDREPAGCQLFEALAGGAAALDDQLLDPIVQLQVDEVVFSWNALLVDGGADQAEQRPARQIVMALRRLVLVRRHPRPALHSG